MSNNFFIQYYNVFAEENSKYHLSIEELYLYGLLSMLKNKKQLTITNVDILQQYSPINFFSRETESKQRIKNNLLSLKQKEIISFPVEKVKNNTLLIISFMENLQDESIGKGVKGFEKIEYDKFNSFPTMIDNYIYFTVKRFDSLGGFKCDYERWSYILNVAERTAKDKIKESVKKGIIYKNDGDYKEETINNRKQKKQEVNTYKSIPFTDSEKSIQTKKNEIKEQQQKLVENEVKNPVHEETETREHNWNNTSVDLTGMDYYIYLTTNDKKLKKKAEGRINAIKNSKKGNGDFIIETLQNKAEEIRKEVESEQLQEKLKSATNAIRLHDDSIVAVDKDNIDNYKFEDIKTMFYSSGSNSNGYFIVESHLNREINFESFQPFKGNYNGKSEYEHRPDMMQLGFKYYVEYVKKGITFDIEIGNELRSKVFDETFTKKENPYVKTREVKVKSPSSPKKEDKKERKQIEPIDMDSLIDDKIDLMNEIMESDNVKKKDELDISDLLFEDEEEVKPEPKQPKKSMKELVEEMHKTKKNPFSNDDDLSCLDELE